MDMLETPHNLGIKFNDYFITGNAERGHLRPYSVKNDSDGVEFETLNFNTMGNHCCSEIFVTRSPYQTHCKCT